MNSHDFLICVVVSVVVAVPFSILGNWIAMKLIDKGWF
jgi:hypothetical protein